MTSRFDRQNDKLLNEKHSKILKELMARPENRKCADCRKKGIFVCIQCSGIHRSIGTHISKVKSADLDTWTPEQVENMVKWGNHKANLYWEHEWPKDMQPSERNMDTFIRAKYERKQYAMKGGIPDPSQLGDVVVVKATQPAPVAQVSQPNHIVEQPKQSASQQLFDAFSQAPTQQNQQSMKNSILSLYGTKQATQPTNGFGNLQTPVQPSQASFANFGDFSFAQPKPTPVANNNNVPGSSKAPSTNLMDDFAAFSIAPSSAPQATKPAFDAFGTLGSNQVPIGTQASSSPARSTFDAFGTPSASQNPSNSTIPSFGNFNANQTSNTQISNVMDGFSSFTSAPIPATAAKPSQEAFQIASSSNPQNIGLGIGNVTSFVSTQPPVPQPNMTSPPHSTTGSINVTQSQPLVQASPSLTFNAFASSQSTTNQPNSFGQTSSSGFGDFSTAPAPNPGSPAFQTPFSAAPPRVDPFGDIAAFGSATKPIAPPPNIDHWSDFQ